MKFYRCTHTDAQCGTGYSWHRTKESARLATRTYADGHEQCGEAETTTEEIDIPPTRRGIYAALVRYASHNDNG